MAARSDIGYTDLWVREYGWRNPRPVYAVEEFGKAILLKKYMTGKKKKCHIPTWILGGGKPSIVSMETDTIPAHDAKLFIGFDYLPPECSQITPGVWISRPSPGKVIKLGPNSFFKLDNLTGGFSDTTHTHFDFEKMTFADLGLKESCFYMDFEKDSKTWKFDLYPDKAKLKKIITANYIGCYIKK
jgi:hypothetical protein